MSGYPHSCTYHSLPRPATNCLVPVLDYPILSCRSLGCPGWPQTVWSQYLPIILFSLCSLALLSYYLLVIVPHCIGGYPCSRVHLSTVHFDPINSHVHVYICSSRSISLLPPCSLLSLTPSPYFGYFGLFNYTSGGLTHAPNNSTCQFSITT